ncbi:MAG TPA: glycosyl transferase family 2 [Cryomorphaceae bacterium]|nr:glycosyl transferase family 2 [Cryomorphaceae bacterium]
MNILYQLLELLELIILIIIGVQVFYLACFAVGSLFRYRPKLKPSGVRHKIAVIIPGYKEDRIIIDTAVQSLKQTYPKELYEVVICADSFKEETILELQTLDVRVMEVKFENSTKAKSVNKALALLSPQQPDIAVILDSDNVMAPDFLEKINAAYSSGYKVIQGHRTAKNQDTSFALLDAINEEIGNSIFRKGHRVWGVSSALIGSAMAFDFNYFRSVMADQEDVAGEDKLVELKVLKDRHTIEYLEDALVYDEKVSNAQNFSKQRTRWVGVQIYFFRNYFLDGVKEFVTEGNFDYFDKAFQMFLVPKVLLIGILGLMGMLSLFTPVHPLWLVLMVAYFTALLLAVPGRFYNIQLLKALLNIPKAILFMVFSILRIRKSTASKFEVTEKNVTSRN